MSKEPMTARERLMRRLAQPIPRVKPNPAKEREEIIKHNCEVLNLDPWTHRGREGRDWKLNPDKTTSYVAVKPTALEQSIIEAVGQAAKQRRAWALSNPLGLYGERETIDDVVKRQDKTR